MLINIRYKFQVSIFEKRNGVLLIDHTHNCIPNMYYVVYNIRIQTYQCDPVQVHYWHTGVPVVYRCTSGVQVYMWYTGIPVMYRCTSGVQVHQWCTGVPVVYWCTSGVELARWHFYIIYSSKAALCTSLQQTNTMSLQNSSVHAACVNQCIG